jgi:sugar/nucleoside kinase (ribokinase family)
MGSVDLVVIGDINPDLVVAAPDLRVEFGQREALADSADLRLGGSAAITACAASRLGLSVAFCGLVGGDEYGTFCVEELRTHGVNTATIRVDQDVTTGLTVILQRDGDRAIVTHLGSIAALHRRHLDLEVLGRARHVHVGSYFLLDGLRRDLPRVFDEVRATGATTSLDTNDDPRGGFDVDAILERCDVLLPNGAEARRISGARSDEEAAATLARRVGTVVVTTATGALAHRLADVVDVEAEFVDPATIIDAIGAGDNFDAGFLRGYLDGWDLAASVRSGLHAAARSLLGRGGTGALAAQSVAING